MAGDWIPATIDLPRRREVVLIAERIGVSRWEVVGSFIDLWGWASSETSDGVVRGYSVATVVAATGLRRDFIDASLSVDWLRETAEGIEFPNWDRWLSNSAKARLGNAIRQRLYRKSKPKNRSYVVATNEATREEKRREENLGVTVVTPKRTKKSKPEPTIPDSLNTPDFIAAWSEWTTYRKEMGKALTATGAARQLATFAEWGVGRAIAAIKYTITKGWQGIYEDSGNGHTTAHAVGPGQRHPSERDRDAF